MPEHDERRELHDSVRGRERLAVRGRQRRRTQRLECGVCWWVYDPTRGDELAQVPPGTPFAALPAHWHCPECEAPKTKFMVLAD